MQALCLKSQVEFYRRNKAEAPNTMGAIYWQLNAIWQAPSWASLEYQGRWKVAHYFARRFYTPVLVSAYELPINSFYVYVTSDVNNAISGTVTIYLWSYTGTSPLTTFTAQFSLNALGSGQVYANSISSMINGYCSTLTDCFFYIEATDSNNNLLSTNEYYLTSLANVTLPTPSIDISNIQQNGNNVTFTVSTNNVSPYVFLGTTTAGRFSDNAFLLLPNQPAQITFYGWEQFSNFNVNATTVANTYT